MELQRTPPPYTQSPALLGPAPALPDELARFRAHGDITLPNLQTVLSGDFVQSATPQRSSKIPGSPTSPRSLPRIEPRPQHAARESVETAVASPSEAGSVMSIDNGIRQSADETTREEVQMREAAEALAVLGNPDFARSPNDSVHMPSHAQPRSGASPEDACEERPLLNLLTEAHPRVGGTINGTLYAYTTAKSYMPRVVQASAEMVERGVAMPVVNTVGSVGRMTGANRAARMYLTPREASEASQDSERNARSKRRRIDEDLVVEAGMISPRSIVRHDSEDSLPAYRASKPPSYREDESPRTADRSRPMHGRTWSQQFMVSATGLGVALSETSRYTLAYCLNLLGRNAEHIATVTTALKMLLVEYDQARDHFHQTHNVSVETGERPQTPEHDDAARILASLIKKQCDDIWLTLKTVVQSISNTAGGALPGPAREFVRNQLVSLPRRWQMTSNAQSGESETSRNAHRMVAFAQEGLDMIEHVSRACKATLDSAANWVQMAGGGRLAEEQSAGHPYPRYHKDDHPMANGEEVERHLEKR
ncbi:transcriptional regulator opi1 [Friedmanniomyces endolithicus]|nr:transcriptional regulator opi1 [Friedmanniomyces endolithicus]KAK0296428.1 transcriptional regulator opi1 [Friedmanniomyces endolithicus]